MLNDDSCDGDKEESVLGRGGGGRWEDKVLKGGSEGDNSGDELEDTEDGDEVILSSARMNCAE